jgi:CBS domain-containing protein
VRGEQERLSREGFRRTLRGKGEVELKARRAKKRDGEVLTVAKAPVVMVSATTRVYDAIQLMANKGFRRLPIVNSGTKRLEGMVTATDIVDYLGGGQKFEMIRQRFDGNFFKAINEPVRLIMTQEVQSVKISATISEAIAKMKESSFGGLPVVNEEGSVKGIITERDITNLFADRTSGVTVAQLMSEHVITALPKTTIFEAERTMASQGFRRLPIVADGKVVGIITAMDIVRFFGCGEAFTYLRSGTIIQVLNNPALDIATKAVTTIDPEADVGKAAKIMREKSIGAMPVVKNEKIVGIVTERDFFKIID